MANGSAQMTSPGAEIATVSGLSRWQAWSKLSRLMACRSQSGRLGSESRYEFDPAAACRHSIFPKCAVVTVEVADDVAVELAVLVALDETDEVADDDTEVVAVLLTLEVAVLETVVDPVDVTDVDSVDVAVDETVVLAVDETVDVAVDETELDTDDVCVDETLDVAVDDSVVDPVDVTVEVAVVISQLKKPVPEVCASKRLLSAVTTLSHSERPDTVSARKASH